MKKLLCILLVLASFSCKKPCKSNQEIVSEFIKREKEKSIKSLDLLSNDIIIHNTNILIKRNGYERRINNGFFLNLKDDADSVYCSGDTVFASCTTNSEIYDMMGEKHKGTQKYFVENGKIKFIKIHYPDYQIYSGLELGALSKWIIKNNPGKLEEILKKQQNKDNSYKKDLKQQYQRYKEALKLENQ